MGCNCHNLYDQDCEDLECQEQRRRVRTAVFDYMTCAQMEEQFEGEVDDL